MYIAQKTLKSMPSTTADITEDEEDDLDDEIIISKLDTTLSTFSPLIDNRQTLLDTYADNILSFDQKSTMTSTIDLSEQS